MSYVIHTVPLNVNEPYYKLPLDRVSQFNIPLHSGAMVIGKGLWLEILSSTDCTIKSDVSVLADLPWNVMDSRSKGWPVLSEEDLWSPCPDLPETISVTAGKIYRYIHNECVKPYRRIRLTVTPSEPTDEIAKRLSYAAFKLMLSII